MPTLDDAIRLEVADDLYGAADAYEEIIAASDASLDAYLNAAFLYWQSTEFGFAAGYHVSNEFVDKAADRFGSLLAEAAQQYPNAGEVRFWLLYLEWASMDLSEPTLRATSEDLVARGETDVPSFYLFSQPDGAMFREQAEALLATLTPATFKNRYMRSIIQSSLQTDDYRRRQR